MTVADNHKPLVSISCITYNHVDFIEEALNGFLMQETDFNFEVLIHDDASTDGTEEIIRTYQKKFPSIIKPLYEETNQWVKGRKGSAVFNFPRAKGKYIALCEGDDYWADPLKLQKQVDFLENNQDVNICFTRAHLLKNEEFRMHAVPEPFHVSSFEFIELIKHYNFIATCTVLFRKPKHFEFPTWFHKLPFGDLGVYKLVSEGKKVQCIDEVMSVYRIHDNGIYSGISRLKKQQNYLRFYTTILPALYSEEKQIVEQKIKEVAYRISKLKFPNQPLFQKFYNRYLRLKF
ncbi:glycosyltransferase [Winogradskyella sediminis]|uniref:glycosyltransferase n=1 Tax=Winogradskyella sediminis TaxID=1382466 RepID=UPI003AA96FAC